MLVRNGVNGHWELAAHLIKGESKHGCGVEDFKNLRQRFAFL